ncbi:cell division protein [Sphingomonas ginkgonis]|uniref:cell division protein n=1 Tax=Sphingomonas ginkgonis TaxID=2315330 RepID=UPI00163B300A|nr:cell division protein [Sphingomonas ginkgonis]
MLAWAFPSSAERRLLPPARRSPTPWVIAIMIFVTVIVGAAGLAVANAARLVGDGVRNRVSVQLPDGPRQSPSAVALLGRTAGVAGVRPVSEAELRRTLQQWLGPGELSGELPVPGLIDVDLAPGTSPDALAAAVERAVPGARVSAYATELAPLSRALAALQWLAAGLVLLMTVAMAAAVVLAARSALDANRRTIEVMHGIGGTDEQVVGLFQRRIAIDALVGGAAGALAAGIILLLVLLSDGGLVGELAGRALLGWRDALLLALLPLLGAAVGTVAARRALLKALRADL